MSAVCHNCHGSGKMAGRCAHPSACAWCHGTGRTPLTSGSAPSAAPSASSAAAREQERHDGEPGS